MSLFFLSNLFFLLTKLFQLSTLWSHSPSGCDSLVGDIMNKTIFSVVYKGTNIDGLILTVEFSMNKEYLERALLRQFCQLVASSLNLP